MVLFIVTLVTDKVKDMEMKTKYFAPTWMTVSQM